MKDKKDDNNQNNKDHEQQALEPKQQEGHADQPVVQPQIQGDYTISASTNLHAFLGVFVTITVDTTRDRFILDESADVVRNFNQTHSAGDYYVNPTSGTDARVHISPVSPNQIEIDRSDKGWESRYITLSAPERVSDTRFRWQIFVEYPSISYGDERRSNRLIKDTPVSGSMPIELREVASPIVNEATQPGIKLTGTEPVHPGAADNQRIAHTIWVPTADIVIATVTYARIPDPVFLIPSNLQLDHGVPNSTISIFIQTTVQLALSISASNLVLDNLSGGATRNPPVLRAFGSDIRRPSFTTRGVTYYQYRVVIRLPSGGAGSFNVSIRPNVLYNFTSLTFVGPEKGVTSNSIAYVLPPRPLWGSIPSTVISPYGSFSVVLTTDSEINTPTTSNFYVGSSTNPLTELTGSNIPEITRVVLADTTRRAFSIEGRVPASGTGSFRLVLKSNGIGLLIDDTARAPVNDLASDIISYDISITASWSNYPASTITTAGQQYDLRLTFNNSITGLTTSDLSISGGGVANFVSINRAGTIAIIRVTAPTSGSGNQVVTLSANSVNLSVGSTLGPSSSVSSNNIPFNISTATGPTAIWSGHPAGVVTASSFNMTLRFTEAVTGLTTSDFTESPTTASVTSVSTTNNTAFTITITTPTSGNGNINVTLNANSVTGSTSRLSGPPASSRTRSTGNISYNRPVLVAPAADWSNLPASSVSAATFSLRLTFTEAVSGLTSSDFSVTPSGASISRIVTSNNSVYTIIVTTISNSSGNINVTLNANTVTGSLSNLTGPTSTLSTGNIAFDTRGAVATAPTATWSGHPVGAVTSASFTLALTFSEAVNGLGVDDFSETPSGTDVTSVTTSDNISYSIRISTPSNSSGNLSVTLNANTVTGRTSTLLGPISSTPTGNISYNTRSLTGPSADWTGEPTTSLTSGSFTLTLTFNENVSGFSSNDLSINNGRLGTISPAGVSNSYTVVVVVPSSGSGTIIVTLASNSVTGQTSSLIGPSIAISSTAVEYNVSVASNPPIATWSAYPASALTTASSSFNLTLSFTNSSGNAENISGLSTSDISTNVGSVNSITPSTGTGSSFTVGFTIPAVGSGNMIATLTANSVTGVNDDGPANDAISNSIEYNIPPISTAAPTASWSGYPRGSQTGSTVTLTLQFSEAVSGFTSSDITTNVGSVSSVRSTNNIRWTVVLNLPSSGSGNIRAILARNSVTSTASSLAGPVSAVPSNNISYSIPVSTTPPTADWSGYPNTEVTGGTFNLTLTFNEAVSGLATNDISVNRGSVNSVVAVGNTGRTYTINLSPPSSGRNTMRATLARNSVISTASNLQGPSSSVPSNNISYNIATAANPPTAEWSNVPTNEITSSNFNFTLTLTFNENVTGLTSSDITSTNSQVTISTITGSNRVYQVPVVGPSSGDSDFTITLQANSVTSSSTSQLGPSADVSTADIEFDIPVSRITPAILSWTIPTGAQTSSFTSTLRFTVAVTGLSTVDFSTNTGSVTGVTGSGTSYTLTITPPTSGSGTMRVTLNSNTVTAVVGGVTGPVTNTVRSISYANVAVGSPPTATWSGYPSGTVTGGSYTLLLSFNEKVRGLTRNDFTLITTTSLGESSIPGSSRISITPNNQDSNGYATTYNIVISTPTTAGTGSLQVRLAADSVFSVATNRLGPSSSEPSNSVNYNISQASIAVTTNEITGIQRQNFTVTYTFDSDVTGVNTADITVSNGNVSFSLVPGAGPRRWNFLFELPTNTNGNFTITMRAAAGASTSSSSVTGPSDPLTLSITFDTRPITVPVAVWGPSPYASDATASSGTFTISLSFSESVSGLTTSDITGASGLSIVEGASPASYNLTGNFPTTGTGSLKLRLKANTVTGLTSTRLGPAAFVESDCIFYNNEIGTGSIRAVLPTSTTALSFFVEVFFPTDFNINQISSSSFTISDDNSTIRTFRRIRNQSKVTFYISGYGTEFNNDIVLHLNRITGVVANQITLGRVSVDTRTFIPPTPGTDISIRWRTPVNVTENQKWTFELTFTPAVSGLTSGDIGISATGLIRIDSVALRFPNLRSTYVITVSALEDAQGTVNLVLNANTVTYESRTYPATAVPSPSITFDNRQLDPVITVPGGLTQSTNSLRYRITFDHPITISGSQQTFFRTAFREVGTSKRISDRTQTGTVVSSTVVDVNFPLPTGVEGTHQIYIDRNSIAFYGKFGPTDAIYSPIVTYDNRRTFSVLWNNRPAIGRTSSNPFRQTTITVEVRWTEVTPVGSFTNTSISFTGAASFTVNPRSDRRSANIAVTLPSNTLGTLVGTVGARSIKRTGTGYGPPNAITFPTLYYDTRPPLTADWQNEPTTRQACPFSVHILFSEPVTGVEIGDFSITGPATIGSLSNVTTNLEWSIQVTPSIGVNSVVTLTLAANSVTRSSGGIGPNYPVISQTIRVDTRVEPIVTWTVPSGAQDRNFSVAVDFGQAVTDVASNDFEVVSTTQTASARVISINANTGVTPAGKSYFVIINPQRNANGTFKLRLKSNSIIRSGGDAWPLCPIDSPVIAMDTRVDLSATFFPPQVQPVDGVFNVEILFNEDITSLTTAAISLNVGTLSATITPISTNPRRRFRIEITPPADSGGSITITLLANQIARSTGGTGPIANIVSDPIRYETRYRHTAVINNPTNSSGTALALPVTLDEYYIPIVWERNVGTSQFTLADLQIRMENRAVGGSTELPTLSDLERTVIENTRDWRVKVTNPCGFNGFGSLTLVIRPGSIPDTRTVLGNFELTKSWAFDTEVPEVSSWNVPTGRSSDTAEVRVTFTGQVKCVSTSDFTCNISGSSISAVNTSNNINFTITVTLPNAQTSTAANVTLAANSINSFRNVPGPLTAQTSPNFSFDTRDPVRLTVYPPVGQQDSNFSVGLLFNRTVTGLTLSDFGGWSNNAHAVTLRGSGNSYSLDFRSIRSRTVYTINLQMTGTVNYPGGTFPTNRPLDLATILFSNLDYAIRTITVRDVSGGGTGLNRYIAFRVTADPSFASDLSTANTWVSITLDGNDFPTSSIYAREISDGIVEWRAVVLAETAGTFVFTVPINGLIARNGARFPSVVWTQSYTYDNRQSQPSFGAPQQPLGTNVAEPLTIRNVYIPIGFTKTNPCEPIYGRISGFTATDVTLVASSGTVRSLSFNFNPTTNTGTLLVQLPENAQGTLTVTVAAGAALWTRIAGSASNVNTLGGSHVYNYDTRPDTLTVTYTLPIADPVTGQFTIQLDFNVPISGLTAASFDQSQNILQGCDLGEPYGQNMVWTVPVTPPDSSTGFMTLVLLVESVSYSGRRGPLSNVPSGIVNFDTQRPAVERWQVPAAIQDSNFVAGVIWNQNVNNFAVIDLSLIYSEGSSELPALVGGPKNYQINVPVPDDTSGTVTIRIAKDSVTDDSGQLGPITVTDSPAIQFDTTSDELPYSPPSVIWDPPDGQQTALTFSVGARWNQTVSGVQIGDFTTEGIDGANISAMSPTTDTGQNYTLTITIPENRFGILKVIARQKSVLPVVPPFDPGPVQDQSVDIPIDTRGSKPYVTYCNVPQDVVDSQFQLQLNWNVGVTGFTVADIQIHTDTGNTPAVVLTAGTTTSTYNLTITPYNNEQGTITVSINADSVQSTTGYFGPALPQPSPTIEYDTRGPIPEAKIAAPALTALTTDPITYNVEFNTPVMNPDGTVLTKSAFRIEGITLPDSNVSLSGSNANYTLEVTPPRNEIGTVNIYLDENSVRSVVSGCSSTEGQLGPSDTQALASTDVWTGEKDVLNYPYINLCAGTSSTVFSPKVSISANWSEDISGFEYTDIVLNWSDLNGRTGSILEDDFTGNSPGSEFNFLITFPKDSEGFVTITIPKDTGRSVLTDNYGPVLPERVTIQYNTIQEDKIPPSVSISTPAVAIYREQVYEISFTWNEPVVGFETSDIILDSGVVGKSLSITTIQADTRRQRFTALLTLPVVNSDTTATITVPMNSVVDEALPDANQGPIADTSVTFVYNNMLEGSAEFPTGTTPLCHTYYSNSENPVLNEVLISGSQRGGAFKGVSDLIKIDDYVYGVAQIQKRDAYSGADLRPVLDIVDNASLTLGNITPSNDLSGENFDAALIATITNGNTAALESTIEIRGTDAQGNAITETLTFIRDNVDDPQTTDKFFNTVTLVVPTGFGAGTLDITVEGLGPRGNLLSRSQTAGAILFRCNVGATTGGPHEVEVLRQYLNVFDAARSLIEYDGNLYFFEGSHYAFDPLNRAGQGDVGHLRYYDVEAGGVHDVGINWRSKFGLDIGGFFDRNFGIHSATASPMLVDGKNNLHMISGYGNLNDLTNINNLLPSTQLTSRNAAEVGNWQWILFGENIEYRIPILNSNETTGWEHLQNFARMTLSVIGFDENGAFFYRPKTPYTAEIAQNTSVHSTTIQFKNNNLDFPNSGYLLIGNEIIKYNGIKNDMFLNVERAQEGTSIISISTGAKITYINHVINTQQSNALINPISDVALRGSADQIYNQIKISYGEDEFFYQDEESVRRNGGQLFEMSLDLDAHQDTWIKSIAESFVDNYKDLHYTINIKMNETFDIKRLHTVYLQVPERAHLNRICQVYQIIYNQKDREINVTLRTL